MKKMTTMAATAALAVALSAGAASATTTAIIEGTNRGEVLDGTPRADTIYAYGEADLVRGYSERDLLYGGNEPGQARGSPTRRAGASVPRPSCFLPLFTRVGGRGVLGEAVSR